MQGEGKGAAHAPLCGSTPWPVRWRPVQTAAVLAMPATNLWLAACARPCLPVGLAAARRRGSTAYGRPVERRIRRGGEADERGTGGGPQPAATGDGEAERRRRRRGRAREGR